MLELISEEIVKENGKVYQIKTYEEKIEITDEYLNKLEQDTTETEQRILEQKNKLKEIKSNYEILNPKEVTK